VRNAALDENQEGENLRLLLANLKMLDELSVPNPGVSRPAAIIRRLMQDNGIPEGSSELIILVEPISVYLRLTFQ
jgi:hypothetical protein